VKEGTRKQIHAPSYPRTFKKTVK